MFAFAAFVNDREIESNKKLVLMIDINLNCDMVEEFGAYQIRSDNALLSIVGSANVACGFHAGDPTIMRAFVARAWTAGVSIGAHPGGRNKLLFCC